MNVIILGDGKIGIAAHGIIKAHSLTTKCVFEIEKLKAWRDENPEVFAVPKVVHCEGFTARKRPKKQPSERFTSRFLNSLK